MLQAPGETLPGAVTFSSANPGTAHTSPRRAIAARNRRSTRRTPPPMRGVVWLNLLSLSRFVNDTAPWLYFSLVAVKSGMPSLQPNTTYYFNMINTNCPSGSTCDMQMFLVKPNGR